MDIEARALEAIRQIISAYHTTRQGSDAERHVLGHANVLEALSAFADAKNDAFRQEVSDALSALGYCPSSPIYGRFIIAKPDPLVEALDKMLRRRTLDPAPDVVADEAAWLRAELAASGHEIREVKP